MKKFFGFIFIFLIIIVVVLFVARNQVVKFAIETGVQKALGLKVEVGKIDINFNSSY